MVIADTALQAAPGITEGIQPLIDFFQPIFVKASLVVGGIFGIYLLLLISRVYYEKKKVKLLKDIRFNLDQLNIYHGIKTHKQKKGMFVGLFDLLKRKRREKKVAKEFSNDVEEEPKKKSKKKKK
ncbi:hypothetical protein HOE37_03925 [Candidatus Woesearchaeota archaeon]|jgi:hypothetical protein|nr:hypothetical protein [Candidatus Woesearchaeota archaeon]MBT4110980.1 hypothetical protein [Candidatus Woesearchaeota archaeon]MBT4336849.1 hypothetical protein [Candidatus Woesearchaeota archaeon]MBT4469836.1 hypothetical protein [Candidatus Woesearchaeota archaeon]MBT6743693.1 hypothetical protein [Candidatus Woesearchaeota archaeon]